ncbi:MAG: multicopper oxidase domain-containing protein [Anaeromyxobacteraceae bacterium]
MTHLARHVFGIGLLLLAGTARAAPVAFDLHATTGTATMPGPVNVPVLGYATTPGATVIAPGGPVLVVTQGDDVTLSLHNGLGEATALLVHGQGMAPDTTGVGPGGTITYRFTAGNPGTFLYEAGLLANAQHQVAMGLHGALVVRPSGAPFQAYADAATTFGSEAVLVLSELDPALNGAANPAAFDMRGYAPRYFLINGAPYPNTLPVPATPGSTVLLRYVNAGIQHHSMMLLGLTQRVIAKDGMALAFAGDRTAETVAPGQTMDALAAIPAGATGNFAVLDASLNLFNNQRAGLGGMLTFVSVGGAPAAAGPVVTSLAISGSPPTLTAGIDAGAGHTVAAAQYWIDSGAPGAMTAAGPAWTATLPAPPPGTHSVSVRGQNELGTWGAARSIGLAVDTSGPATSALALSPAASNGTVSVNLTGTADDRATGGAAIAAGEYAIDGGAAVSMTPSPSGSPVASISATIAAATVTALAEGSHAVSVRSQDVLGNWGAPATVGLVVDKTGPAASSLKATPGANNGSQPLDSTNAVVRVSVRLTDALSSVLAGEGFIDVVGANGTGFPLLPVDGRFDSGLEDAYADIPLSTVGTLSSGSHAILVRGRDAAGNWGAAASLTYLIDRTAPTFTGLTVVPSTAIATDTLVATPVGATDPGGALASGLAGGQYWIDGAATPPANPIAFAGSTASIPPPAGGTHTVYLRIRDAAGNFSAVRSAALTVLAAVNDARSITANGNATQTSDTTTTQSVLANDLPGGPGRTAALAVAPARTSGTGAGTVVLSCPAALGTPATPAVGGNTICTNGRYRVTLNGVGASNTQRRTSKLGAYQFTYTMTLNGRTTPPATVTITVN